MYIPKDFYERAPYYWMVLGVLLILVGTYLGSNVDRIFYYIGIGGGAFACGWGLRVFQQRLARNNRKVCSSYDEYLQETCELNLNEIRRQDETA